jgi:hypothetical protein
MQAAIDRHCLVDPIDAICIVESPFELHHGQKVWAIPIYLIRTCETKGCLPTEIPRGHQQVQGAYRIDIEVIVRNRSRQIMRWLRRGVNHKIWSFILKYISYSSPVTYIKSYMAV